jgi:transposase-like protein
MWWTPNFKIPSNYTLYSENIAPKTAVAERIYGSDGLNERQRIAANYLARGTTIRETARKIGVSEKSVYLWRQRVAVQQAIARIQQELLSETGGMNISTIPDAIKLLDSIINDPEARNTDRIAAARTLMSGAQAYQERKILERQINDLERQLLRFTATQNAATNATPIDPIDPPEDDELLLDAAAEDDSLLLNILDSD